MNSTHPISEFLAIARSPLARVERIAQELRRGHPVTLYDGRSSRLVIPAETLDQMLLDRLATAGQQDWYLAITPERAERLGIALDSVNVPGRIALPVASLNDVLSLVDPTLSIGKTSPGAPDLPSDIKISDGDDLDGLAILLLKHAGLLPAAIIGSIDPSTDGADDLVRIDVADIREGIKAQSESLKIVSRTRVPLEDSENVEIVAFRPTDGNVEHLAIVVGTPDLTQPVLIRLHSECFTGDLLGSLRCDCGNQLRGAISLMANTGGGILLYLAQEGRGIGLVNKLRAYQLQDAGQDTVDANLELGFQEDERDYAPAVEMLKHLGVRQARVLTNNPRKVSALTKLGVNVVERVAHVFPANHHNRGYLFTKGTRGGHLFDVSQYQSES